MMGDSNGEHVLPSDEDPTTVENPDLAELNVYAAYLRERYQQKVQERQQNIAPDRPSDEDFLRYDSSVKKNTAFVRRLKQFTAQQLPSLMQDVSRLNLTKYISEVSASLVGAKLKMSDIDAVLILCTHLHRNYADFAPTMLESWRKLLTIKPGDTVTNPSKMRVDLRFFAELISLGIFLSSTGMALLRVCLNGLILGDKEKHLNLSIVLSFGKHCGNEFAGLVPKRITELANQYGVTMPVSSLIPPALQCNLRNLLHEYYESLVQRLQSEHKDLQLMLNSLRNTRKAKNERMTKMHDYEMLHASVSSLADLLGEALPLLEEFQERDEQDERTGGVTQNETLDPWRDRETKSFYVDLPDLSHFLPNYCKTSQDAGDNNKNADVELDTMTGSTISKQLQDMDLPDLDEHSEDLLSESSCSDKEDTEPFVWSQDGDDITKEEADEQCLTAGDGNNFEATNLLAGRSFKWFVRDLQRCINREMIDKAAIEFLQHQNMLRSKIKCERLVKVLFGVQRTRLDLLPMYARFVAIVNLVSSDVAQQLGRMLKADFVYHLKKKDQIKIETKIKLVRYIGELVKFGLYKKAEALSCLRRLLQSFQHHNVEMACAFLEVCGVYLYNCPETRMKVDEFLEQMMRQRMSTTMLDRHVQQVESVYYLVKRPVNLKLERKKRPIMHTYIRQLIFQELGKSNVEKTVKLLRCLNWDDVETSNYAVQCLSQAYNVRYNLIPCLADVMKGLYSYQEQHVFRVIDTVLEDIRAGMEIHCTSLARRQVAMVKYLGELYNFKLVESDTIFKTLYSFISFGVNFSHDEPSLSVIDPPESLFRLKLACVLLNTCGKFLDERRTLDHFLVFFQQYYWHKKSLSHFVKQDCVGSDEQLNLNQVLMDQMYHECLSSFRANVKLYSNFEEANDAVVKMRQKFLKGRAFQGVDYEKSIQMNDSVSDMVNDEANDVSTTVIYNHDTDNDCENSKFYDQESAGYMKVLSESATQKAEQQEDIDFKREFERIVSESCQEQSTAKVKHIPVPQLCRNEKGNEEMNTTSDCVTFTLMRRGKGKQQLYKMCEVPQDNPLAQYIHEQERKLQEEKANLKQLTLCMSERLEEEIDGI